MTTTTLDKRTAVDAYRASSDEVRKVGRNPLLVLSFEAEHNRLAAVRRHYADPIYFERQDVELYCADRFHDGAHRFHRGTLTETELSEVAEWYLSCAATLDAERRAIERDRRTTAHFLGVAL